MTAPERGHLGMLVERFSKAYGARHLTFETLEETTLREAVKRVFGQDRLPAFDIEHTQHILSFGSTASSARARDGVAAPWCRSSRACP